jgi:glycine cleavage system H protein
MSAGLVLYKLCDRDYNCSICPFDQAMRGEPEEAEGVRGLLFNLEPLCFYHPCHLWVRIETPQRVLLGIDALLSFLIRDIKAIVFPKVGDSFSRDEQFCHIIEARGIVPLPCPISGTVTVVNLALKRRPELLKEDPYKAGFLVKMRPENLERDVKGLVFGREAQRWLGREEKRLLGLLGSGHEERGVGPTMQDGGEALSVASELPDVEFMRVIEKFVRAER